MFDLIPASRAILVFSDPAGNRHAFEALLAEAQRRGLGRDDLFCISGGEAPASRVAQSGARQAQGVIEINGVRARVVASAAEAARVFASTPDRVLDAELAAAGPISSCARDCCRSRGFWAGGHGIPAGR